MTETKASGSWPDIVTELVRKLAVDPCLLAVVIIVSVCALLIMYTFRHHEKMEAIRAQQAMKIAQAANGGKKK